MRRLGWLLTTLAALVVALVVVAPARVAGVALERASQGALALTSTDGTLWHGRGTLRAGTVGLPVTWRLEPGALLRGNVAVTLGSDADDGAPRGRIEWSPRSVTIEQFAAVVPAGAIAATLSARPRLDARGRVLVRSEHWTWSQDAGPSGNLDVGWEDAAIALAGASPVALGNVRIALAGSGDGANGPVQNEGGEVAVDGTIAVAASGAGTLDLLVRPRRADDPALAPMLRLLGTPERDGTRVRWTWPAP